MALNVIVVISLAGFSVAGAADADWSYRDEGAWPSKCQVGPEQSPIDIKPYESRPDPFGAHIRGPLVFRGYSSVRVTAANTGYTVKWSAVPGEPVPVLSGGPLRANYSFAEVHFHWLSEHSVNGIKYPMEIHIVHIKTGLTIDEALLQRDGVAVLAVLAQVSSKSKDRILEDFLPAIDQILKKTEVDTGPYTVDLTRLFSPNPQGFYTYHGSLTTPLCPEVVTWIVMDKPTTVTHEDYRNITQADLSGINNDRTVQPLNKRLVFRSKSVSGACTQITSSSLVGSVALMVTCLGSKISSSVLSGMNRLADVKKRIFGRNKNSDKF